MTSILPIEILEFHRALLDALGIDHFRPGMADVNMWKDFLFFLDTLKDSAGGPLTAKDITAALRLMRQENRDKRAGWSLRYSRILREPESFRDLVLQARKQKRERGPVVTESRTAGNVSILTERDPAADEPPKQIAHELRRWRESQA
jgi:hypothetical protein